MLTSTIVGSAKQVKERPPWCQVQFVKRHDVCKKDSDITYNGRTLPVVTDNDRVWCMGSHVKLKFNVSFFVITFCI